MSSATAAPARRRVLIVEDDPDVRRTLERCLVREGCEVTSSVDGKEAAEKIDRARPELVITDLEMPRAGGREVVALAVQRRVPVVVLTGHGTVSAAVELMRAGAANFLTKPFTPDTLRSLLSDTFGRTPTAGVVGNEDAFRDVLDVVGAVAETDATVLITGESGTGKEVVARAIHRASKRARGAFVAVNCGAIPEALLESELFGHAQGRLHRRHPRPRRPIPARRRRHAVPRRDRRHAAAAPGQAAARVCRSAKFEALGAGTTRSVDVRIIAATHRDLRDDGHGRQLSRGPLLPPQRGRRSKLPPLRDRASDIPLLAEHFIAVSNTRHGTSVVGAKPEVLEALARHRWPGNVRELGNVIERMVIFQKRGLLEAPGLPATITNPTAAATLAAAPSGTPPGGSNLPAEGVDLRAMVAQLEETLIDQALERTGGNRNAAAQLLGLNRTTLVEKLKRSKKPIE